MFIPPSVAAQNLFAGSAPQSVADVKPIETAIRQIDDHLRIVWNPKALLATPGLVDQFGLPMGTRYEGRWQVVIPGKADGEPTVVWTLGAELGPHKPYREVGWWLVDFLREWDTANAETMRRVHDQLAMNDRLEAAAEAAAEERKVEAIERHATDTLKHRKYPGRGARF